MSEQAPAQSPVTKQDVAEIIRAALKPIQQRLDSMDQRLENIEADVQTIKALLDIEEQVENLRTVFVKRRGNGGLPTPTGERRGS